MESGDRPEEIVKLISRFNHVIGDVKSTLADFENLESIVNQLNEIVPKLRDNLPGTDKEIVKINATWAILKKRLEEKKNTVQ